MSRDHTIRGIKYYDCDLCGITYRIIDTLINDAGLRVCKDHDVDIGAYRHPAAAIAALVPFFEGTSIYRQIITQGYWSPDVLDDFAVVTGGY